MLCGDSLLLAVREVDAAANLNDATKGVFITNSGELVAYLNASGGYPELAAVASGAIAWVEAIDIKLVATIGDKHVAPVIGVTILVK